VVAICGVGGGAFGCPYWYFGRKNVLFEESLADKFLQVPPKTSVVNGRVSLAFVKGTILFRSRECGWFGLTSVILPMAGP